MFLLTTFCLLVMQREDACLGSSAVSCGPDVEAWRATEEVGVWEHPPTSSLEDKWLGGPGRLCGCGWTRNLPGASVRWELHSSRKQLLHGSWLLGRWNQRTEAQLAASTSPDNTAP